MKELTPLEQEKINIDIYYKKLYEKHGLDFILNAGFIFDNSHRIIPVDAELDCTPIAFLLEKLKTAKRPAILLGTGSYCPVHDGHIEAMYKAREVVEASGYDVIGGYMAPDNDDYVQRKAQVLNIHERIEIMGEKLKDHDWLAVDPWNGIFRPYAENFTALIEHLQLYIKKHLGVDIPIFYVCGGDNARFALTFIDEGYCVVVDRPGSDAYENFKHLFNDRILYAFNDNLNSSTMVRKSFIKPPHKRKRLILRVDSFDERQNSIIEELSKHFDEIVITDVYEEQKKLSAIKTEIISLDSLLKAEENLAVSRVYDYFGQKFLGWSNRPGTQLLKDQIDNITPGGYFLFDDDKCSGATLAHAKNLLKDKVTIHGAVTLTTSTDEEEIADVRDFYFNKENCGLVIQTSELETKRFPYVYPYVCPFIRTSIRISPMTFSMAIWSINCKYFTERKEMEPMRFCLKMLDKLSNTFPVH